jgi:hypothetical protein
MYGRAVTAMSDYEDSYRECIFQNAKKRVKKETGTWKYSYRESWFLIEWNTE